MADRVVPSDLAIEAGRGIVVSGPNAGGKTVALKTMGLAALMVRAGMPVACAEGSTVGLLDVVLTDVGDDQSLHKNLSTFSAHVKNLADVLAGDGARSAGPARRARGRHRSARGRGARGGGARQPLRRGAAPSRRRRTTRGSRRSRSPTTRFVNASVGFDLATMTPTFELAMGVPGSSSALAVARRYGMPATVIERAERFLTREDQSFEAVVQKLHDERAALALARAAAEQREGEATARAGAGRRRARGRQGPRQEDALGGGVRAHGSAAPRARRPARGARPPALPQGGRRGAARSRARHRARRRRGRPRRAARAPGRAEASVGTVGTAGTRRSESRCERRTFEGERASGSRGCARRPTWSRC